MTVTAPTIYSARFGSPRLGWGARFGAGAVAASCATILCLAAYLNPNPAGVGSHAALGLARCEFLDRTGIPCPSCGMTTSFAYFFRGNLLASLYVQPMGMILAFLTATTFWTSLYITLTGRPALRLLQLIPAGYYFLPLMFFGIAAWGWKIFIHLNGIDGWR